MLSLSLFLLLVQASEPADDPLELRVFWKDGIRFETPDRKFQFRLRVKMQLDAAWMSEHRDVERAVGTLEDGTEFRRARIGISGRIYERIIFSFNPDFAGGSVALKAVYVGMDGLPLDGVVRVGHLKEPFGLERRTSSSSSTFAERALTHAVGTGRNVGADTAQQALGGRVSWAAGVYRETDNSGAVLEDGKANFTARLSGLPLDHEGLLGHLGVAYSRRNPNDSEVQYDSAPEVHLAPDFVDTGILSADAVNLYGAEAGVAWGPFSLQGEAIIPDVELKMGSDPRFFAGYVYASWLLTGESRPYDRLRGRFTRVKPREDFPGGGGAWEVAVRYSQLDLDDKAVRGGTLRDVTVGVNWYLNPVLRVTANTVFADLDGIGRATLFVLRFDLSF